MRRKALKAAFPHTFPVMAGYLFLGIGFGILLESKGFAFPWAILMSIIDLVALPGISMCG